VTARTILVLGATGATGRRVVAELLERGHSVRAMVRSTSRLPAELRAHPRLQVIEGSALELDRATLTGSLADCDAVVSCLGHRLGFRGVFGSPRRLVTESVVRLCTAIEESRQESPVRFVLMSSAGVRNRGLEERVSSAERLVLLLLRLLLPPHADNEQAAEYLHTGIGRDNAAIEWCVVRPDTLLEGDAAGDYDTHESPTRSAIFNAGQTRRAQVAQFMALLATDDELWGRWRFRMPVIYNRENRGVHDDP